MSLQERLDQLEPRERMLLGVMGVVFAVLILFGIPLLLSNSLSDDRKANEELREAMRQIRDNEAKISLQKKNQDRIVARYENTSPPLQGLLAKFAKKNGVEIPESQDRATVPHGKSYEERSTKISLRKVGMASLAKFMEDIERSGYPVKISKLNIRKRSGAPDQYDVSMTVSAFDRKVAEKKKSGDDLDEESDEEEEG